MIVAMLLVAASSTTAEAHSALATARERAPLAVSSTASASGGTAASGSTTGAHGDARAADASVAAELDASTDGPSLWAVHARVATIYVLDPAIDAFSDGGGAMGRGEVALARRLDPRWAIELGAAGTSVSRVLSRTHELTLTAVSLQASLAVREPLWWHLVGVARATASLDLGRLVVDDDRPVPASQTVPGVSGMLTAGVALDVPIEGPLALVISAEGGFQLHSGFAFDAVTRDADGDTEPARLAVAPVDAGSIALTGALWKLGVALTF
jgi:hypothetical protein